MGPAPHLPIAPMGPAPHLPIAPMGPAPHLPIAPMGPAPHLPIAPMGPAPHLPIAWKRNLLRIRSLVLIGGPDDGVITPWQSSFFGFYDANETVREMQAQEPGSGICCASGAWC
uniref:Uncharacterized protein n=1 Tax=Amazona collaria TaxID=241587 RepID=A0A8B9G9M9_9PSIT